MDLVAEIAAVAAENRFSGVVRVDLGGEPVMEEAYGLADRRHGIPMTVDTRVGVASASKGMTALAVMALVEDGVLRLDTTARSLLGGDLPLVDDDVTVEHLLGHRSGIGDYLDEEQLDEVTDYIVDVPAQRLLTTEDFLPVLDGHPQKFAPDEGFAYCNGGFVVLALLAERASGIPYHDLVQQKVCEPAGMVRTEFLRSDELPGDVAIGYLFDDGLRWNVFHLPVRATGDGGVHTTAADLRRLWAAVFDGRIVSPSTVAEMIRPRSDSPEEKRRYGLGFWLNGVTDAVFLEGYDAGASCRSVHRPSTGVTFSVLANTSEGAWPVARRLHQLLDA